MLSSALVVVAFATGFANPPDADVKRHFESEDHTVEWGKVVEFDPTAELDVTDAHDHFLWNLCWYRFRPGKDGVEVVAMHNYGGAVIVESARMTTADYKALLHALAVVNSATLKPVPPDGVSFTWHHFVWQARLTAGGKTLLHQDWKGAPTDDVLLSTKPKVAVILALSAVRDLKFQKYELTAADRVWASAKFRREWGWLQAHAFFTRITDRLSRRFDPEWPSGGMVEEHWWVRARVLTLIGEIGDESVLPALRGVLLAEPHDPNDRVEKSIVEDRWCAAINAATRLLKKDDPAKPVEVKDVVKAREKALELLKGVK